MRLGRVLGVVIGSVLLAGGALAQQSKPRIWDVPLGTDVRDLPAEEFVDPACGTNGGPPGQPLAAFAEFERCAPEPSGLREVWFIYDDTLEYVGRAMRDDALIGRYRATAVLGQPVILSYLVDASGIVQGYRVFTDPRAEPGLRLEAHDLAIPFRARFGSAGWQCTDLSPADGETPLDGIYLKQLCAKETGGRQIAVEARHYHKPGQYVLDPFTNKPMVNEFESWARLDVRATPAAAALAPTRSGAATADAAMTGRDAFLAGRTPHCAGCDLREADLRRRNLADADLSGANLEGAVLHRANLRRANLAGANLAGANLNRTILTQAKLAGAVLTDAMLYETDAGRADFTGADLSYALMGRARLVLADLSSANLDYTDLSEARLNDANLSKATLNEAFLRFATLFRADLRGAVATRAILADTGLRGADLSGASLRESDLSKADLTEANLTQADFSHAKLGLAILLDTKQDGAIFTGALMPDRSLQR